MPTAIPLKLVTKDYDYFAPLAYGDVKAEGIDLNYERDTANVLDRVLTDASIHAGEIPFGRYLNAIGQGRSSLIGIAVGMLFLFCGCARRADNFAPSLVLLPHEQRHLGWSAAYDIETAAGE